MLLLLLLLLLHMWLRELRHHLRLWVVRMGVRGLLRLAQLVELMRLNREIHCESASHLTPLVSKSGSSSSPSSFLSLLFLPFLLLSPF
jgi:hypothetical protein